MMAFVQLVSGKCRTLPNDKARELWLYLHDGGPSTPQLEAFAETVQHIWLNRHNAPPSYLASMVPEKQARLV